MVGLYYKITNFKGKYIKLRDRCTEGQRVKRQKFGNSRLSYRHLSISEKRVIFRP